VSTAPLRRAVAFGILLCFFSSGAAGLVYQVAWSKALGLVFGHTVYAIATVLAVFMGGLALGSAWLGRWSERHARPVALYGWIELGVAATGALSLAGLAGVRALYLATYHMVAGSAAALLALRFAGAAIVLFLPTFLMGGTLPMLVRGLTRSSAELGFRVSRLYWVNTAGAVAGTLAAGFLFLPAMGLRLTVAAAVALNVLAGSAALLLSGSVSKMDPATLEAAAATPAQIGSAAPQPSPRFLLASFAVVGATAMAYEIGWTRLLATTLGSSTYAFTLMLATFLAGLALGSALFERWLARSRPVRLGTFARTQTLTAAAALLFLIFFQQLPRVVPPLLRATHESFGGLVCAQFLTSALAMLPAATIFGFNFPAVTLLIAGRGETAGHHAAAVGRAYAANTLGAIAGAVATGFWLVPWLGSFRVIALAAAANLLLAVALELRSDAPRFRRRLAAAADAALLAVVVAAGWSGAFYNRTLATFGTVLYWNLYRGRLTLAETAATTDIVFAADGLNASISVARAEDYLALRTNGKVDASNRDATTQLLVGHLGAIFHAAPRRVLVIGFGSGMTVSAVARYPEVERIDCVEIEPAVIRAAAYLEPLNRGVLRDPRLRVVLDDARNFLLTTREKYDLIISEPSNPWIAGVATLFTGEYYRAARARLAPGGVFVQWVQAYSLYPEDLRMVLATFVPQFPRVTLWHGDAPDLLLLAQTAPAPLGLDRLRALWPNAALRADYEALGLRRPEGLLAFYLLDDADLRRLATGAQRNTDDRTLLEYRAPRALLAKNLEDSNRKGILEYQQDLLPPEVPAARRAVVLAAAAETMLNLDEKEEAERFLAPLDDALATVLLELLRGRLALARESLSAAEVNFKTALQLDPSSLEPAQGLADVARHRGEHPSAELLLRQILARDPEYVPALDAMMSLAREHKDWQRAADWQTRRIAADRAAGAEQYSRLGELLLRSGDLVGAERALGTALEREPYSYDAHRNLAELYRLRKLWPQARQHLEFIVRYSPDENAEVYAALAEVDRAMGDASAATEILRKGLRIFPHNAELRNLSPLD
jgi:spermidine synthase